jgi:hypothetical protein
MKLHKVFFGAILALLPIASIAAGTTGNGPADVTTYGVYPSATPSLAPNQKAPLTFDQRGNLNVNVQVGGGGTGGGGAVYPAPASSPFPVSAATTLPVQINAGSASIGYVGLSAGSNTIGNVGINAGSANIGSVTAGSGFPALSAAGTPITGANAVTVQGNSSGVPIPVTGAFYPATQPISAVSPIPISAPSAIPVNIGNFPATQPISAASAIPVNCLTGCSSSGGSGVGAYYNPSPTPIASATSVPLLTDNYGRLVTAPSLFVVGTPLPVTLPTNTPSLAGFATQGGVAVNNQAFGYDGDTTGQWWPIITEQYGVQVVTTGGTVTYYYAGGGTGGAPVKQYPGRLVSIANMNASAQTVTFNCYDNATAPSGNVMFSGALPAYPTPGWQVLLNTWAANGIFCQPTAATKTGNPIVVQYE